MNSLKTGIYVQHSEQDSRSTQSTSNDISTDR